MKKFLIILLFFGFTHAASALTLTVYPDADPETTSVDGMVGQVQVGLSWASITGAAGNSATPSTADNHAARWQDNTTNTWQNLSRGIFLFDTSSLGDCDTINSGTMSIYGNAKNNGSGSNSPTVNVYTSTPASNTNLVGGDFAQVGSTAQATAITFTNFSTTGYNDFTLNGTGLSNISKTGITKFGTREASYDVTGTAPTWAGDGTQTYFEIYFAEQTGTANDPKLVIDYTSSACGGAALSQESDFIVFE